MIYEAAHPFFNSQHLSSDAGYLLSFDFPAAFSLVGLGLNKKFILRMDITTSRVLSPFILHRFYRHSWGKKKEICEKFYFKSL